MSTVPTAESDSPKASVTLGAYLLRRGGGAAGAGWRRRGVAQGHSVQGSAPSGFATQAGQGVTAALGVGHDNGGGDALPPVRLELGYRIRCGPWAARLDRRVELGCKLVVLLLLSNELLRLHLSHPVGIAPPHYSQHALYRPRTS